MDRGFTVVESAAKRRWRWAIGCIKRQLRLKYRFFRIGEWCKLRRVQDLSGHLARSHGELRHKNKQCTVEKEWRTQR